MVFSSLNFIFKFLPCFFICYFLSDKKKNIVILIYSLYFYFFSCFNTPLYLLLLVFSLIINYFVSIIIYSKSQKFRKIFFVLIIIIDVLYIFSFKYFKFFIIILNDIFSTNFNTNFNILLPIGISFYSMQIISYIIDVYYGKVKVCKNIFDFCTYILFFPQLIAGPIVRYNEVEEQLKVKNINIVNIYYGIITFVFGLAYKVILANQLSLVAVDIDKHFENMNFSIAWLSAICYILQLYFDFYGYSLMAIGLGKIIGFNLPINFRTPLLSKSISEFWTRWHITLNTFLRDYIYIPLGGSKNGIVRTCINLFVVFLISGIWHGAYYNYILFGISFGILIIIERIFLKKFLDRHKVFSHIYTVFFVVVIFVFFANEDMNKIFVLFKSMFTFSNGIINESLIDILKINWKQILLGLIFATNFIQNRYTKKYLNKNINIFVVLILFIISIYLIFIGSNDPFLYFRF